MSDIPPIEDGFSARLRTLRRRAAISQEELSRRSKVSRRTLIRWESGAVSPWIPELVAVLRALEVSEVETQELIRTLGTTRANRERQDIPADQMGRLLRVFRLRAGLSMEQVAAAIKVNSTTIGRWESGALTPNLETQRRLLDCLRVHPREIEALSSAQYRSSADSSGCLDEWEEELDGIRWWWDEWAYVLLDVRFLDLIFRLRSAVNGNATLAPLLGRALAFYANALSNCHRFSESDHWAEEATRLLETSPGHGSEPLAISILVRARSVAYGSARNGLRTAMRHLNALEGLPLNREFLSWRLTTSAECYARHGALEKAIGSVDEAIELTKGHLEETHALRRYDRARILLAAGRPHEALDDMPPLTESSPGNIASEALLWSDALSQMGRAADAAHWRSVAERSIAEYHLEPIFLRQKPFALADQ